MTKEAKLQAAMRILPEWVGYDEEIKTLQQKVENANRQTEKDSGKYRLMIDVYLRDINPAFLF
jgi:UDP-glucose:glycoprotein glucosyltransferase